MLGIPGDVVDATEHLLAMADDWNPRAVDVGVVNGRCFTFASGLGLDASVVEQVDSNPRLKARLGAYYFTWVAYSVFTRRYLMHPPRLCMESAGETLEGVTAIIQNGSPFTYFNNRPVEVVDGPALDSGTLSAGVLHRATPMSMASIAYRALSSNARVTGHRQVTGLRDQLALSVSTADERPLPLQVDGDYVGEVEEARYSILPRALTVVS
jgi:diacylglycerol kinase family enzyme